MYRTLDTCLVCENGGLELVVNLGLMPSVNTFANAGDPQDRAFPLQMMRCERCGHCQLSVSVDPTYLFSDYSYVSATTGVLTAHSRTILEALEKQFPGRRQALLEVGSNDGTLLELLQPSFQTVLGVDPAANLVTECRAKEIEAMLGFFGPKMVEDITTKWGRFSVILGRHVFAHVPDPAGVLQAMADCLEPNGVIAIETPHLLSMFENVAFDTIYHEHISYFSAHALARLAERVGLSLIHLEEVEIHGGSLLAFFQHKSAGAHSTPAAEAFLKREIAAGILTSEATSRFAAKTRRLIDTCRTYFSRAAERGQRIWGYGASAKASVLLNSVGPVLGAVERILDRSPYKVGKLTPGTRIPVVHPDHSHDVAEPDEIVILSWNLAPEIVLQLSKMFTPRVRFARLIPEYELLRRA